MAWRFVLFFSYVSRVVTNLVLDHQGPVSTYMASCNGDCTTFTTDNARWFKLDATGYENGQWGAAKLISGECVIWARRTTSCGLKALAWVFSAGQKWVSTIPVELASGQYVSDER